MPRRNSPPKRQVAPDNKFQSVHITMFINRMMYGGKRSTAMGIMYDAMDIIEEKLSRNPLEIFDQALRNVTPAVEVKPRRVGGSTYQVPVEVDGDRGVSLAMRWLLANSRSRAGKGMPAKLAAELIDAANGQGNSIKKKDETHRMAEANRALAHYK